MTDLSIEQLMVRIPGIRRDNTEVLSAAIEGDLPSRCCTSAKSAKRPLTMLLRLLIRGVVMQMFEEV